MKIITQEELEKILANHKLWLENKESGNRADLSGAYIEHDTLSLKNSDLRFALLISANLSGCDLSGANISRADLSGANFSACNLSEANLEYSDLSDSYLIGADLKGARLIGADLRGANLSNANFKDSIFE
jgi:uncharacterized protein YjbI with pentapeptide repeats